LSVEAAAIRDRVLVVDDDEQVRDVLGRILGREGYRCTLAAHLAEARTWLARAPFDLILCDVRLPDGSGLDLVQEVSPRHEPMAALMISALDDAALAERALQLGAYGYIVKPFAPNDVLIGVLGALRQRRVALDMRGELRASHEETIQRLCIAVEARDPDAAPQISQMSGYCWHLARQLDLPPEECELIRVASPMHDIGKIAVPDRVLLKKGPLTAAERTTMQSHAEIGYRILAGSRARLLRVASMIAWTHHERVDGSGYPRRLGGEDIPLEGRIAAVADVFVALTRDRAHRARLSEADAMLVMEDGRGRDFDPGVLDAFFDVRARLAAERTGPEVGLRPAFGDHETASVAGGGLSPRERQVLQLAADGLSPVEIAEELVISPATIKTHFHHIYSKLEARDRAGAVATGLRRGLIE
jgi:putative two-component system response regulator